MDAVFTRKNKYRNFLTNMTGNSRQVIILLETVLLASVNAAANHILRFDRRVSKNLAIVFTRCSHRGSVCENELSKQQTSSVLLVYLNGFAFSMAPLDSSVPRPVHTVHITKRRLTERVLVLQHFLSSQSSSSFWEHQPHPLEEMPSYLEYIVRKALERCTLSHSEFPVKTNVTFKF